MGLKKYEIITVGSDKRVRALRSWQVGDRYVNIGDVGGIVYDEKTLSQDGACWLFRGNFGFPGARIGGDSIVDVGEVVLSATGAPNVDILGSSVVVGSKLQIATDQTAEGAVVLTANDFEQGLLTFAAGANWESWKGVSNNYVRSKAPIFLGGAAKTLKLSVPGFMAYVWVLDRDGIGVTPVIQKLSGAGVTLDIPAGYQYFVVQLVKEPFVPTVPADATAAQITFTGTYETKLSIIDSRVEINPAAGASASIIKPGAAYTMTSGAKYPEAIIRNSKVSLNTPSVSGRVYRLLGQIIGSTATLDATADHMLVAGKYSNVKNLQASGILTSGSISAYDCIQATDCDNFAVSPTIFPGLAAARTANMPFVFQGCNMPNGIFYHHAQIANTYKNIDFALAQSDLGKQITNPNILVSSEVEGMYRLYSVGSSVFGALVESYDSVRPVTLSNIANSYGTTIYKDAYLNGRFDIAGTNVFGHKVRSHPLAQVLNVQPRAVQGTFNTTTIGETITGVVANANRVCVPLPFRVNGSKGVTINFPTGFGGAIICTDIKGVITSSTGWVTAEASLSTSVQLQSHFAYVLVGKVGDAAITPADLAGVTVTVYNGCKIVNTGETAVNMKGNIRVEDNATLTNCSITGTGYFGGNAVASKLSISGCCFMKGNASFTRTVASGSIRDLKMTENAYAVLGDFALNGRIHLSDNARFTPTTAGLSEGDLVMKDNAVVSGVVTIGGVLTLKDNVKVSAGALSTYGDITLCGSYNQTTSKTWIGKRVIDNENAPEYDNNVKTQYDF